MYETNLPPLNWNTILALALILIATIFILLWARYELNGGGAEQDAGNIDTDTSESALCPRPKGSSFWAADTERGSKTGEFGIGMILQSRPKIKVPRVSEIELLPYSPSTPRGCLDRVSSVVHGIPERRLSPAVFAITTPAHSRDEDRFSPWRNSAEGPLTPYTDSSGRSIGLPAHPSQSTSPMPKYRDRGSRKWKQQKKGFDQEQDELLLGSLQGLGSE